MSKDEIFEKVKDVVVGTLGVDPKTVTRDTNIIDQYGADSLDWVETIMGIEEEFEYCIPQGDAEEFKNIGDAVDYLAKQLSTDR